MARALDVASSIEIMFYCMRVDCFVLSGLAAREQPQVLIQVWDLLSNVVESQSLDCPAGHNFNQYKG